MQNFRPSGENVDIFAGSAQWVEKFSQRKPREHLLDLYDIYIYSAVMNAKLIHVSYPLKQFMTRNK